MKDLFDEDDFYEDVKKKEKTTELFNKDQWRNIEEKIKICIDENIANIDYMSILEGECKPFDLDYQFFNDKLSKKYQNVKFW